MPHTGSSLVLRDCSACGEQRAFEAMVCTDGHGADCPELACVDCGEALLVGSFQVDTPAETLPDAAVAA